MNLPGRDALEAALEATWPPARAWTVGPWRIRDGAGGGKRVSAATAIGPVGGPDLGVAETEMQRLGQPRLFRARGDSDDVLSGLLDDRGYGLTDISTFYASPCDALLNPAQAPLAAVASETCLGIQAEIWAAGGIGPGRLLVMGRASTPRCWLLDRVDDRAAGTAFLSVAGDIAMIHAIEVRPAARRRGAARALIHRAASWAADQGAGTLALAVTAANGPGNALYTSLGMQAVGQYHYRIHPDDA